MFKVNTNRKQIKGFSESVLVEHRQKMVVMQLKGCQLTLNSKEKK